MLLIWKCSAPNKIEKIDPTSCGILNGHPTKIAPDKIFGGVVQNQDKEGQFLSSEHNILETLNSKHYKTKQTPLHLCASGKWERCEWRMVVVCDGLCWAGQVESTLPTLPVSATSTPLLLPWIFEWQESKKVPPQPKNGISEKYHLEDSFMASGCR